MPDQPTIKPGRCGACGAELGADQRYCVECGTRRGPMPSFAALAIGAMSGAALVTAPLPRASATTATASGAKAGGGRHGASLAMPTPRVAALAVMGMLAFGVVLGSLLSPNGPLTTGPLLLQSGPPAAKPAPAPTAAPAAGANAVLPPAPTPIVAAAAQGPPAAPPAAPNASKPPKLPPPPSLPPVKHVFLIVLSGHGFDEAFGPNSTAPYLSKTLSPQGELLQNYYAVAPGELSNEIALISGQGPTPQMTLNCPTYADVAPGTVGSDGQVAGDGCVLPAGTPSLPDQLSSGGKTWKAYVEDVGNAPGQATTCRRPTLGGPDPFQAPVPGDGYVTWRNPFAYFHSLLDSGSCDQNDVALGQLTTDLQSPATTPSFAYIVPSRCHDGSDVPCAPNQPAGLPAADAFLSSIVPQIQASPAYAEGSLIAITFAAAPQTGPSADPSACCAHPQFPNLPPTPAVAPGAGGVVPAGGGGKVGLLLLSPFVKPGTVNTTGYYDHFTLLRSIEDLYGLTPIGYAANPALTSFDQTIYNNAPAAKRALLRR